MFNWRKNSNKNKKGTKPRAAPAAHRHPQYKPNPPRPPAVSERAGNPPRRPQTQPKYNPRPQPLAQRPPQVTPQKPPSKQPPSDDDDSDDDMFADMNLNEEEEDDEEETEQETRNRTMSVEELNKLSEAEQITLALRMSIVPKSKTGTPSAPSKAEQTESIASTSPNPVRKQPHVPPAQPPTVDKINIEWPSIPNNTEAPPSEQSSAFGFVLNDNNEAKEEEPQKSAFGFVLNDTEEAVANAEEHTMNNMNMNMNNNNNIFGTMNINTITQHKEADTTEQPPGVLRTLSYTSSQASPPPSTSLGPQQMDNVSPNQSVLSQLKRCEQQHERSRKRIWAQIRSCIEREQRIKFRENELNDQLITQNNKKKEAEDAKKIALRNADFEEAEKSKNVIRRSLKNIQDISHQLTKIEADIKRIKGDKNDQEQVYMRKNKEYRLKLDILYRKHEENMTTQIGEEFVRIESAEKKYKEKLDRTEREIQLDEENIERTADRLEVIEDLIKNDTKSFADNLDKKAQDKSVLELEIEELNRELTTKKKELENVETEIDGLETEIESARSKYKTQMDDINEERSRYEKSRHEFNTQKTEYLIKLSGLNEDNERNKDIEREFEDELNSLKLKMSKINESFERYSEREMRAKEWRMEEERLLNEEKKLNKRLDDIAYECEKYEKELKQMESKCTQHRQIVATIDTALPILHSDKITAVNNENYLDAGKIHKTIQSKQQQKDNSLHVLKELSMKQKDIKDNLKHKQTQNMQQIRKELSDIKIKIDKQRFEVILDHENNIKQTLTDLGDMKVNDDDVEKIVLNLELKQLQSELVYFNDKYGWSDRDQYIKTNAEILNNAEEDGQEEEIAIVTVHVEEVKQRTKDEIEEEIKNMKDVIEDRMGNREEIQKVITAAVDNDDYETAGKLAPNKKDLIAEINDLNMKLEALQYELKEVIDNEDQNDDDIGNDNDSDNDDEIDDETENNGLNGVINETNSKEDNDDDDETKQNEENGHENVVEETQKITDKAKDIDVDNEVNEDNEDKQNENNDDNNDSDGDGDVGNDNMFGNMAVAVDNDAAADGNGDGDDQPDTVNID